MTVEKLHDAIGLLPADLVTEADAMRRGRPKVQPWKRYLPLAASFALVLCAAWFAASALIPRNAAKTESLTADLAPAAAAPLAPQQEAPCEAVREESAAEKTEAPASNAAGTSGLTVQTVQTPLMPATAGFSGNAAATLVTSRAELDAYLEEKAWIYDFAALRETCGSYSDAWFADHDLLLLTLRAAHTGFPHTVTSLEDVRGRDPQGWDWFMFYTTAPEDHPEGDLTCLHLLTELQKGLIAPEDSILAVADPIS